MGRQEPGERLPRGSAGPVLQKQRYYSFLQHRFTVWSSRGEGLNDRLVDQQGAIKLARFIRKPPSGFFPSRLFWATAFEIDM